VRRKRFTVAAALRDTRWMQGLRRISTTSQVQQFVHLWPLLRDVRLVHRSDDIQWHFTANGTFTKYAYQVQFMDLSRTSIGESSGRQRRRASAKFLLGSSCKIGCGRRTGSSCLAVTQTPSLPSTWSLPAPTMCGYGGAWSRGWESPSNRYRLRHTGGYGVSGIP
jgi:hypothetical protein